MEKKIYIKVNTKEEKLFALHYLSNLYKVDIGERALRETMQGINIDRFPYVGVVVYGTMTGIGGTIEPNAYGWKAQVVDYSRIHTIPALLSGFVEVKLNSEYTAKHKKGEDFITVGCQQFTIKVLEELLMKVRGNI